MNNSTATMDSGHRLFVVFISFIAALAGLLFGYDTGVISGAILFIEKQFTLTSGQAETVVSVVLIGALVGAITSGRLADRFGRKKVLLTTALIFAFGALGSAFARSVPTLVAYRFIIGLAIGVASYTAPLYLSEISPKKMRGALVSLNQLMITVGILVSYFVDYGFSSIEGWRWMLGIGIVPALILFSGMLFLPESPRWLVLRGFVDKARSTLMHSRHEKEAEAELEDIKQSVATEKGSWRMLFKRWMLPVLFVGIGINFFQQFTGINTIIYYAPTIFKLAGFQSNATAILATVGVGVVNVALTVVSILLIDRVGRRPLLFLGLIGMIVSLTALGIAFHFHLHTHTLKWVAMASMLLYIACFAISLGPIAWLVIAEIFPLRVRGLSMSLATASNWTFNWAVSATFLTLLKVLHPSGTFWMFALLGFLGLIFIYWFMPETKGSSLEQIEFNLKVGKSTRELGIPVKS